MNKFLWFIAGAAVGAVVSGYFLKAKYKAYADEEIEAVRDFYREEKESEQTYVEIASIYNGSSMSENVELYKKYAELEDDNMDKPGPMLSTQRIDRPYVISPDEYGEFDDYMQISLTLTADNKLLDDQNNLVDDVDDIVGFDSLMRFGEYEDDSVHVRNDALRCDYEILKSEETYDEIVSSLPPNR